MELPNTLERCYELIQTLAEENATLRKSGDDFGRLAERLNTALQEERRRTASYAMSIQGLRSGLGKPQVGVREDNRLAWSAAIGVPVHVGGPAAPPVMTGLLWSHASPAIKGSL